MTINATDDAELIANSILDDPTRLVGAEFTTRPIEFVPAPDPSDPDIEQPAKTGAVVTWDGAPPKLGGFPVAGSEFGLLTSGSPLNTTEPMGNQSDVEYEDPPDIAALRGSSVHDLTTLKIDVDVPAGSNCLVLQYRFLSEEFPEYVGSRYNDAFIAELDTSNWTTDAENNLVIPNDFATNAGGKPVSVNGVGPTAVSEAEAEGTIFDAATGLVTTKKQVSAGAHSVFLSIFDQSDHVWDSTVMLDRLAFITEDPSTCKPPEVPVIVPPPPPPPAPPGPPPPPPPVNDITIPGGSVTFSNGAVTVTVQVPGPGTLNASQAPGAGASRASIAAKKKKLIKPATKSVAKAGKVKLRIKLTKAGKKQLNKKKKLKVRVAITFTPTGGTPNTEVAKLTIKKKAKKKN